MYTLYIFKYSFTNSASMLWTKVELQGPPPACRLDFGMCQVSLFWSLMRVTDDQDLVTQVQQTKEILDRELKPGSASSRDSRQDTGSGMYSMSKKFCNFYFKQVHILLT